MYLQEGAFAEVVKGVEGIEHTVSSVRIHCHTGIPQGETLYYSQLSLLILKFAEGCSPIRR